MYHFCCEVCNARYSLTRWLVVGMEPNQYTVQNESGRSALWYRA